MRESMVIGGEIGFRIPAHGIKQGPGILGGKTVAQRLPNKGGKNPVPIPLLDGIAQQVNVCAVPLNQGQSAGRQGL